MHKKITYVYTCSYAHKITYVCDYKSQNVCRLTLESIVGL